MSKKTSVGSEAKILIDPLVPAGTIAALAVRTNGGAVIRNIDLRREYESLAPHTSFEWIGRAVKRVDEIAMMLRRNIQKSIALDAFVVGMRAG